MAVWSNVNTQEIAKFRRIDGEFFHPKYIQAEAIILGYNDIKPLGKLGDFLIGPFGSAFHVNNYDNKSCYRYVRGKDVKPFSLLNDDNVYMPEKDYKRLQKYALHEEDLLISVVGTLGNVAIVSKDIKGIFSCKSTVFRNSKVNPYFLLAYFNSTYGRECLLRRQRGAIQTGLNKEDLKTVPVPLLPNDEQSTIGKNVKHALKLLVSSNALYAQAQEILERELGLDKLVFDKPLSYLAKLSDVVGKMRGDAEYHNPMLKEYYQYLSKKQDLVKITEYSKVVKFGNPTYSNVGIPIITQKHLQDITPSGYGNDLLADNAWVNKYPSAILRKNDLLFYSVGAYLGKTNIWLNEDKAVHASFITMLRCHNEIDCGYLMVLLNSKFGILQSKVFQSGTSQQYIYPKDIRKFLVPQIKPKLRTELYNLIIDSQKAKTESHLLLEQAKRRVEELIEQAVQQ